MYKKKQVSLASLLHKMENYVMVCVERLCYYQLQTVGLVSWGFRVLGNGVHVLYIFASNHCNMGSILTWIAIKTAEWQLDWEYGRYKLVDHSRVRKYCLNGMLECNLYFSIPILMAWENCLIVVVTEVGNSLQNNVPWHYWYICNH